MTTEPMGNSRGNAYRSYLVRFWQSHEQGSWRASAQCVQTGNTLLFGNVENLLAFLQAQIGAQPSAEPVARQSRDFSS